MSISAPSPEIAPELLLGDIMAYIDQAQALLQSGDSVLLEGLGEMVDQLCQRVGAMDVQVAKEYTAELEHVRQQLDMLQASMLKAQQEVKTTIQSLGSTKKASNAYQKNVSDS
jgi:hypothetical protein